jgi:hypothetical protein
MRIVGTREVLCGGRAQVVHSSLDIRGEDEFGHGWRGGCELEAEGESVEAIVAVSWHMVCEEPVMCQQRAELGTVCEEGSV